MVLSVKDTRLQLEWWQLCATEAVELARRSEVIVGRATLHALPGRNNMVVSTSRRRPRRPVNRLTGSCDRVMIDCSKSLVEPRPSSA